MSLGRRELPRLPRTDPNFSRSSAATFSLWIVDQSRSFPEVQGTSPEVHGTSPEVTGQPLSLAILTPSADSQTLSLNMDLQTPELAPVLFASVSEGSASTPCCPDARSSSTFFVFPFLFCDEVLHISAICFCQRFFVRGKSLRTPSRHPSP